jgi:quercetin dioxygenase-like cupin family protein
LSDATAANPNYSIKSIEVIAAGTDVLVRLFTLAPGDEIPWHYHSQVTDWYFGLEGRIEIETRAPRSEFTLVPSARYSILPKTAHRLVNESAVDGRFLLVQGIGRHDFNKI